MFVLPSSSVSRTREYQTATWGALFLFLLWPPLSGDWVVRASSSVPQGHTLNTWTQRMDFKWQYCSSIELGLSTTIDDRLNSSAGCSSSPPSPGLVLHDTLRFTSKSSARALAVRSANRSILQQSSKPINLHKWLILSTAHFISGISPFRWGNKHFDRDIDNDWSQLNLLSSLN